jgi:hypothetical protein
VLLKGAMWLRGSCGIIVVLAAASSSIGDNAPPRSRNSGIQPISVCTALPSRDFSWLRAPAREGRGPQVFPHRETENRFGEVTASLYGLNVGETDRVD